MAVVDMHFCVWNAQEGASRSQKPTPGVHLKSTSF